MCVCFFFFFFFLLSCQRPESNANKQRSKKGGEIGCFPYIFLESVSFDFEKSFSSSQNILLLLCSLYQEELRRKVFWAYLQFCGYCKEVPVFALLCVKLGDGKTLFCVLACMLSSNCRVLSSDTIRKGFFCVPPLFSRTLRDGGFPLSCLFFCGNICEKKVLASVKKKCRDI